MNGNKDSRKMKMFDYYLKYIHIYNNFEHKIYFINLLHFYLNLNFF